MPGRFLFGLRVKFQFARGWIAGPASSGASTGGDVKIMAQPVPIVKSTSLREKNFLSATLLLLKQALDVSGQPDALLGCVPLFFLHSGCGER